MTNRERVAIEHPEKINPKGACGVRGCPGDVGYPELPQNECHGDPESCTRCWNLENETGIYNFEENENVETPTIKDSGDRTQFESGAVRDMREGKGRCDLMPLYVVSHILGGSSIDHDPVIRCIENYRVSGNTEYLYNAIYEFCDCIAVGTNDHKTTVTNLLLEVAKHFEEGAKKYGENNWQKGIPIHCYIDSAVRHYLKWLRGDKDEPHDRAFVWNIMCCIWEVDYHKPVTEAKK